MKTRKDYVAPYVELVPLVMNSNILIASDQYGEDGKAGKETPLNVIGEDY